MLNKNIERLCQVCNQTKKTPYKNICRNCYQLKWLKTIPEKHCIQCNKVFKQAGKTCWPCLDKKRNEKIRQIPCSQCGRKGLLHSTRQEGICLTCNRKNREKSESGFLQKRRDKMRTYARIAKGTPIDSPIRKSEGFWKTKTGYVMTYKKGHPNSNKNDCIQMHTYVMSEYLGRPLTKDESVHHINGIRDDNHIENLELWHRSQPSGQRLHEKIKWARDFLESYGFKIDDSEIMSMAPQKVI